MSNAPQQFTDRRGGHNRASGRRAVRIPARTEIREAPMAQEAGAVMATYTPSRTEAAERIKLDERARQLQVLDPHLSYNLAVMRASEQLQRNERIVDPDHTLLTSMAQRWAIENGVNDFGQAFRAVAPAYERIVAGPAAAAEDSTALDRATRRRMAEDPKLSYRDALLQEAATTPAGVSRVGPAPTADESGAVLDWESQSPERKIETVRAYMKNSGLNYKAALLELDKQRRKA